MTLRFGPFNHRVARVLAVVIPCALALALGMLQFGWIRRAAVVEAERRADEQQRRGASAVLDVRRAVESSFDDLRLAVSIMRTAMGMATDPESAVAIAERALTGWHEQTAFPELIRGVWLMSDSGSGDIRTVHVTIDSRTGSVARTVVPRSLLPIALTPAAVLLEGPAVDVGSTVRDMRTALGDEGYVLMWAAIGSASETLGALEVDTSAYLQTVLPYYLRRDAPAYEITIHPPTDVPTRTDALMFLSVPSVWYASLFAPGDPGSPATAPPLSTEPDSGSVPGGRFAPGSPSQSSIVQPGRVASATDYRFAMKDSVAVLSFSYSAGPQSGSITGWLITNLTASAGITLLFLGVLVGALLLFMKTRELRTSEAEFVASMSHELRLPITVIGVIADSLSAGIVRDSTRMTEYGDQIRRQTRRLSTMVEGMLLSAGLNGEGARPSVAPVVPCETVAQVVEEIATLAKERAVAVTVECIDGGTKVGTDAAGFSLVLRNLMMNAVLHAFPSADGGPRTIGVRLSIDRPAIMRLEVTDNGPGIPKKEQKTIFEPFARTAKSLAERHQGSGLGLHIARRVARLNDGSITLSSPYVDADGVTRSGCRFVATMRCSEVPGDA